MKLSPSSGARALERIYSSSSTTLTARQTRAGRSVSLATPSQQYSRFSSTTSPALLTPSAASIRPSTSRTSPSLHLSSSPFSTTSVTSQDVIEDTSANPLNVTTYYDLFPQTLPHGPPPAGAFTIDLSSLRREFLQLQARAHPDRHAGDAKAGAEIASSAINEAYKTLQDPLRRAQYLLMLRGVNAEDEADKLGGPWGDPAAKEQSYEPGLLGQGEDMELLMEVMDAREAVEAAEDEEDVRVLKVGNEARIAESVRVLEEAFENAQWERAKKEAVRLRYWRNIADSLHEWDGKGSKHALRH